MAAREEAQKAGKLVANTATAAKRGETANGWHMLATKNHSDELKQREHSSLCGQPTAVTSGPQRHRRPFCCSPALFLRWNAIPLIPSTSLLNPSFLYRPTT